MNKQQQIHRFFYKKSKISLVFTPISFFISQILKIKYYLKPTLFLEAPVIVVGNITMGGTGKTPCIVWLYNYLKGNGWNPAILTRGYRGSLKEYPHLISEQSTVAEVGDEPFMLYQKLKAPIWIDPNRGRSAKKAIEHSANILLLDDGLQSSKFSKMIQFCLIDASRYFGNEQVLPFGPLRESLSRLNQFDFLLLKEASPFKEYHGSKRELIQKKAFSFEYRPLFFHNLQTKQIIEFQKFPFKSFNALCGISNPNYFFDLLSLVGNILKKIPLNDHESIQNNMIPCLNEFPLIVTEKDCSKILSLELSSEHLERIWFVSIELIFLQSEAFELAIKDKLQMVANTNE